MRMILLAAAAASSLAMAAGGAKPFTVPEVGSWSEGKGSFAITPSTSLRYDQSSQLGALAGRLAEDLGALTGMPVKAEPGKPDSDDILLRVKPKRGASAEAYTLTINPDGVVVEGAGPEGVIHGAMTLMQLAEQYGDIPAGQASDAPAYPMRGLVIDAGRKYIPLDYLYKLVDVLAYYKMNVLHVHLNDNGFKYFFDGDWDKTQAAFRLESDNYPQLTARDGSYTKDEFRRFVKYAATRGVEIVPEIDFPAHSLAFTRLIPEIGSTDDLYGRDHLDLGNPLTYEFLDTLLAEYMEGDDPVFAGPRVHIGTDEYSNRDSVVVEQFRALTDRYIRYVEKFGKLPAVWGALTHANGVTPVKSDNVLMYSWYTGYANPYDMLEQGYDLISIPDGLVYIVPEAGYYYDYLNNAALYANWTPAHLGADFRVEEGHPQVKGGMFAVWNDHPGNGVTVKDIHHRIMAALPVMAAKTWSGADVTIPYDTLAVRSSALSEAPGVNYLGRYDTGGAHLLEVSELLPGTVNAIPEIGYDYVVEFDIEGADEQPGTALFVGPESTFWLSDPISGQMGFSREGYLSTFRQDVRKGDRLHVKVAGDNKHTRLWVNGRMVDDLVVRRVSFNGHERQMAQSHTLVFPLERVGMFRSRITNLKVTPQTVD